MPKRTEAWRQYQEDVAAFFRSLGYTATTDARIPGVRAKQNIDVLVTFEQYGWKTTWIIECKHVGRNVSKVHVEALKAIVADVGADRGVLLSEKGFQRGAHDAAQFTNLELTSLSTLRQRAEGNFVADRVQTYLLAHLDLRVRAERLLVGSTAGPGAQSAPSHPKIGEVVGNILYNLNRAAGTLNSILRGELIITSFQMHDFTTDSPGEFMTMASDLRGGLDFVGSLLSTASIRMSQIEASVGAITSGT